MPECSINVTIVMMLIIVAVAMSYNREVSWEFLCKTMLLDEKGGDKESSCLFSAFNWIVIRFDTWTCHVGFFFPRFLKYGLKKKSLFLKSILLLSH